jgi:hypothetical protein
MFLLSRVFFLPEANNQTLSALELSNQKLSPKIRKKTNFSEAFQKYSKYFV